MLNREEKLLAETKKSVETRDHQIKGRRGRGGEKGRERPGGKEEGREGERT